jgi:hypothetical protein
MKTSLENDYQAGDLFETDDDSKDDDSSVLSFPHCLNMMKNNLRIF